MSSKNEVPKSAPVAKKTLNTQHEQPKKNNLVDPIKEIAEDLKKYNLSILRLAGNKFQLKRWDHALNIEFTYSQLKKFIDLYKKAILQNINTEWKSKFIVDSSLIDSNRWWNGPASILCKESNDMTLRKLVWKIIGQPEILHEEELLDILIEGPDSKTMEKLSVRGKFELSQKAYDQAKLARSHMNALADFLNTAYGPQGQLMAKK